MAMRAAISASTWSGRRKMWASSWQNWNERADALHRPAVLAPVEDSLVVDPERQLR